MFVSWRLKAREFLVLVLFVILAFYYRSHIPLFETPDEPSHFSVIKFIVDHDRLPSFPTQFREGSVPIIKPGTPEYYAPPFYYSLMSLFITRQNTDTFFDAIIPNPDFGRDRGLNFLDNYSSKNMYVHSFVNQPSANWVMSFWRLRLFSLFVSSTAVYFALLIGKKLWPNSAFSLFPAILMLFNSSYLYLANGVSNDPLLIAISSGLIYVAFLIVEEINGDRQDRYLWLFVGLLSLALLTKQTAVIFVPILFFIIWCQKNLNPSQKWRRIMLSCLFVGLVGGSWYWINALQAGDIGAISSHRPLPPMDLLDRIPFFGQQLSGTYKSYWAAYGWATIFVARGWYIYFAVITIFGLLGWQLPSNQQWTFPLKGIVWGVLFLNSTLMAIWLWRTAAPYGRLLYPTIIPFYCILVEGWRRIHVKIPKRYFKLLWQFSLIAPIAYLAVTAPSQYIAPAFASPLTLDPQQESYTSSSIQFGDNINLVGYSFPDTSLRLGDPFKLTLYWQTDALIGNDLLMNVQVSLLDVENKVAILEHWAGSARYPTSVWQTNTLIRQELQFEIDKSAVAPALYWFNVSLREPNNQQLLEVYVDGIFQENQIGRIGPIRIASPQNRIEPLQNETDYTLGNAVKLNGYEILRDEAREQIEIKLHWESIAPLATSHTVFVHLLNENQSLIAQSDQLPLNGNYPTNWWNIEDELVDIHILNALSQQSLDGAFLYVGMYDPTSNTRLVVRDQNGQNVVNNAIPIFITP